jgi:hypothetical protein
MKLSAARAMPENSVVNQWNRVSRKQVSTGSSRLPPPTAPDSVEDSSARSELLPRLLEKPARKEAGSVSRFLQSFMKTPPAATLPSQAAHSRPTETYRGSICGGAGASQLDAGCCRVRIRGQPRMKGFHLQPGIQGDVGSSRSAAGYHRTRIAISQ